MTEPSNNLPGAGGNPPAPGDGNTPPAGTPPAGSGEPGKQAGDFFKSQEDFDRAFSSRWAEKMTAFEKELGIPIKDAKAIIEAKRKADDANKTELEKLTGERDGPKVELERTKLQLTAILELLAVGADPAKVPKLLKRVHGKTAEEIKADIAELKADGFIPAAEPPAGAQGAGNPGTPPANQKKVWKRSEIVKTLPTADAATLEEINKAEAEGRIDYNS